MGDRRLSITFSDYLTGGVPDGPLWREAGPADAAPEPGDDPGRDRADAAGDAVPSARKTAGRRDAGRKA